MVYRIFVEKKEGLAHEASAMLSEARNLLGIEGLENIRVFNRYDAENISGELFAYAVNTVFSEPQLDNTFGEIDLPGACATSDSWPSLIISAEELLRKSLRL